MWLDHSMTKCQKQDLKDSFFLGPPPADLVASSCHFGLPFVHHLMWVPQFTYSWGLSSTLPAVHHFCWVSWPPSQLSIIPRWVGWSPSPLSIISFGLISTIPDNSLFLLLPQHGSSSACGLAMFTVSHLVVVVGEKLLYFYEIPQPTTQLPHI